MKTFSIKPLFLLFLFLNVCASLKASSIPDSLTKKLDAAPKEERLGVWIDWYADLNSNHADVWINALDECCNDAYEVLEADSALIWCFRRKMVFAGSLDYGAKKKEAHNILKVEKVFADSIAELNGGKHVIVGHWLFAYANSRYQSEEIEISIEYYLKAKEYFNDLGYTQYDFKIYKMIASGLNWISKSKEALKYLEKADSISKIDSRINEGSKKGLKYRMALTHKTLGNLELAESYFDMVLLDLESSGSNYKNRVKLDYTDCLCSMGKLTQGIELLKSLEEGIMANGGANVSIYYAIYADCLLRSGDMEGSVEMSHRYRRAYDHVINDRRDADLLEWQTKLKTQEKEAEIKALQLEQDRTNTKIGFITLLSLLGLSILSFLLYRNRSKRQQAELKVERDRQIIENRDRLFSSITHDIRTPLALMMAPLERVEQKIDDEQIKSDLHLAQRNGKRLMELFNQILDWNKAEAKALTLNNQLGQLEFTLSQLCSRFVQQASEQDIVFQHNIKVPKGQFMVDYDKLDKILSNLIGNAIKFCDVGNIVSLKIDFVPNETNPQLDITVTDNGPGIFEEDQEKLFTRFYQGAQGKLKGGTGIGLALVKELVTMMKGDIKLDSKPEVGTTFSIKIPVAKAADMAVKDAEQLVEENYTPQSNNERPLLLVVEDEPELLDFLHSALKDNYEVEKAASANVGLSIAINRIPDIIISDWTLPDHNGGWLCKQLRKNPLTSHIPTMILTAHTTDTHQQDAFDAGAVAWMNKPFKISLLQKQLKTIFDQQVRVQLRWSDRKKGEPSADEDTSPMDPFLQKVMGCIEKKIDDEYFGVEQMAEQLNLSRVQLFRKVKSLTGDGPRKLLTTHRLEKAKKMLSTSGQTIGEIAFSVGFSDPNYFSRAYKKHFNVAPSEDQKG